MEGKAGVLRAQAGKLAVFGKEWSFVTAITETWVLLQNMQKCSRFLGSRHLKEIY